MKTEKALKASYGTLLGTNADIAAVLDKTKNIWMYTFLEIFKEMLDRFSGVNVDELMNSDPKLFVDNYLNPIVEKVNSAKKVQCDCKFNEVPDNEDTFDEAGLKGDVYDLLQEIPTSRITNPAPFDLAPDIAISQQVFMEPNDGGAISFPYDMIPIMNIIPGTGSVYHRYQNMYNRYFKESIENDMKERMGQSSILEISLKSLIKDYNSLVPEWNTDAKTLSSEGMAILKSIVFKYTDFALPLIMINLRRDYEFGSNLIDVIFNYFSNNYQSAMVAQRYMYAITNALIYSKVGSAMLKAYSLKYATSTLDLLNPNWKYSTLVAEELSNIAGCDCIKNYLEYNKSEGLDIIPIVEYLDCEREATSNVMTRIFNTVLAILSGSVCIDGSKCISKKLSYQLSSIVAAFGEEISPMNYRDKIFADILLLSPNFIEKELLPKVAAVQMVRLSTTAPGARSNDNQFTCVAQEILSRNEMSRACVIGTNSAAMESGNYIRGILNTKTSNEVMRLLATECENIKTFEDAKSILSETRVYKEALKASDCTTESAETNQFKIFLNNVENKVLSWEEELKSY